MRSLYEILGVVALFAFSNLGLAQIINPGGGGGGTEGYDDAVFECVPKVFGIEK